MAPRHPWKPSARRSPKGKLSRWVVADGFCRRVVADGLLLTGPGSSMSRLPARGVVTGTPRQMQVAPFHQLYRYPPILAVRFGIGGAIRQDVLVPQLQPDLRRGL